MMTHSGPIGPLTRRETQDRSGESIATCWERGADAQSRTAVGEAAAGGDVLVPVSELGERELLAGDDDIRVVALGPAPPAAAVRAVTSAPAGTRVYVVAAPEAPLEQIAAAAARRPELKVLVRRVDEVPTSALVAGRGRCAGLFLAPSTDAEAAWWLRLSEAQGAALFALSLRWFWYHAGEEAWLERGALRWGPTGAAPFDLPAPVSEAAVRAVSHDDLPRARARWYDPAGRLPTRGQPARVLVPPSGNGHDRLQSLVRDGVEVTYADLGLPLVTLSDKGGVVVLADAVERLQVTLTPTQTRALGAVIDRAAEAPRWRFRVEAQLGSVRGPVWLADAAAPVEPAEVQEIDGGRVTAATLADMHAQPLPHREPPTPTARAAVWTWTVDPPRTPRSVQEDPLVLAWRTHDQHFEQRTQALAARLAQQQADIDALGRTFDELSGAVMGFKRANEALVEQSRPLVGTRLSSSSRVDAERRLGALIELEAESAKLARTLDEAVRTAREDRDRRQQREQWQARRDQAGRELPAAQAKLAEIEAKLAELEAEEVTRAEVTDERDRKAKRKKLKSDRHRLEQQRKSALNRVTQLTQQLEREFEHHARASTSAPSDRRGGARFVPQVDPAAASALPAEDPPRVGRLVMASGAGAGRTRYLIIERWEELTRGEREAERLAAVLVAPAEEP
ncbi:hypothetical protein [Haliangium sp.]|uniref:hypothetical protein n=1 Tax=Haliangium sp. TaxID=2663208 RepID=UPI003D0A455A